MDEKCILDPERDCIGKAAAAKLEMRIEILEKWRDDSKQFHKDFYAWQLEQEKRDSALDEKLSSMETSLGKLVARQESADQKPGKRWDDLMDKAIWAVMAAVIAFVLAKFGL